MSLNLVDVYQIENFIDTFALGHYARVTNAIDRRNGANVALKIMRTEHLTTNGEIRWEFRAFPNEAQLLQQLALSPNLVQMLDCGYISSQDDVPFDGEIESFGHDVAGFVDAMEDFAERQWRPYLTLENLPRTHNLLYLMKPSRPNVRWRLPTEEGLALALQFAQILKLAHQEHIVYLDHKLEHVYWDGQHLKVIDLNSSRQLNNNSENGRERYFRMDIHNLCVGILYPIFTGLSPVKGVLRPQPSDMNEVEGRYQDVNTLDFGIEPLLSKAVQDLLQRGAAMEIASIDDFKDALQEVATVHGWDFPKTENTPGSRLARDHMRQGLQKLREGQEAVRLARDLFREAAILDEITPDLQDELRRIVIATNEMLNNRVIP